MTIAFFELRGDRHAGQFQRNDRKLGILPGHPAAIPLHQRGVFAAPVMSGIAYEKPVLAAMPSLALVNAGAEFYIPWVTREIPFAALDPWLLFLAP